MRASMAFITKKEGFVLGFSGKCDHHYTYLCINTRRDGEVVRASALPSVD